MQLCGALESRQAAVDKDIADFFASKDNDQNDQDTQITQLECSFCFTQKNIDFKPVSALVIKGKKLSLEKIEGPSTSFIAHENIRAIARGPPVLLA